MGGLGVQILVAFSAAWCADSSCILAWGNAKYDIAGVGLAGQGLAGSSWAENLLGKNASGGAYGRRKATWRNRGVRRAAGAPRKIAPEEPIC